MRVKKFLFVSFVLFLFFNFNCTTIGFDTKKKKITLYPHGTMKLIKYGIERRLPKNRRPIIDVFSDSTQ